MMRVLLVVVGLVVPRLAASQTGAVTGTVEDAQTGYSLPGANVLLVETLRGAAAEYDGRFAIPNVRAGTYTVRISFVGYHTIEERIVVRLDTLSLKVRLEPDFARYDEVVVTGMAAARSKATADVAVSRIDARKLQENNDYASIQQLATGKVAGLTVLPTTGNVGAGPALILRAVTGLNGNHQPIIYIDGVRIENGIRAGFSVGGQTLSALSALNPSDIESIDILKGPAGAALYGTSGSNGVILITTSKGTYGSPTTVDYSVTMGSNSRARTYDAFTASTPDAANAIFRKGVLAEHTVELRGGTESVRYFTSYNHRNEDGHIRNSAQDRQSLRANVEVIPSPKFRVGANTFYLLNDVFRPLNDQNDNGYLSNVTLYPEPYLAADSAAIDRLKDVNTESRFTGSLQGTYSPVSTVTFNASVGYDGVNARSDNFTPSGLGVVEPWGDDGHRFIGTNSIDQFTYNLDGRLAYTLSDRVTGATTVGFQAFQHDVTGILVARSDYLSSLTLTLQAGDELLLASNSDAHEKELGLFATQELAYRDQLFVTLGIRRDYASTIGSEAPSIFYPRVSFALRLDRVFELNHLSFFKVRSAYGEAGQLPDPLDGIPLIWSIGATPVGPAAQLARLGNPELKPERIGELEFGLEAAVFENRLSFDGTYYRRWARQSILGFPNPPSSGLTAGVVPSNIGSVEGWGFETSLSAKPIYTPAYDLEMTLFWQWQDNEVTDLGGAPEFGSRNMLAEGIPFEAYMGWTSRATFFEDGRYNRAELTSTDEDGDGVPDRKFLGVPYPTQNGSFLVNFKFLRRFRLSALVDWQLGGRLYNRDEYFRTVIPSPQTNAKRNIALVQIGAVSNPCDVNLCDESGQIRPDFSDHDVSAQEVGSDAYREAAEMVARTETRVDNIDTWGNFVEDTDFVKLREVSIRYDLTDTIRGSSFGGFIRSASIVLAARNLFTNSSFSGIDPELNQTGTFGWERAALFTLPQPRTIYGTLSIGF